MATIYMLELNQGMPEITINVGQKVVIHESLTNRKGNMCQG